MFSDRGRYFVIEELEEKGIGTIFTDKNYGDVKKELFLGENRVERQREFLKEFHLEGRRLIYGSQTHSDNVEDIRELPEGVPYKETDGFITARKDVVIFTQYADCLPVYFYSEEKGVIGLSHSGWQGSYQEIAVRTLEKMEKSYGCRPEEVRVYLGIGIGQCCYEVGDEFYEKFRERFDSDIVSETFERKGEKWYFDNTSFNYLLLKGAGVKKIQKDTRCTYCEERFHSYRRDGKVSGRNGAFIYFKD